MPAPPEYEPPPEPEPKGCPKCGGPDEYAPDDQLCPFAEEIYGKKKFCRCCADCWRDCKDSI